MINPVPPGIIFLLGALLIPLIKPRLLKQAYLLLIPVVTFVDILALKSGTSWTYKFLEYELIFARVDKLSLCVGYVFVIIGLFAIIYALHVKEDGQHVAAFMYVGSSLGVVFAGDLFSIFFFWEIMAATSVFLIWYSRTQESLDAGYRYLLMHILGGCTLLAGIIIHVVTTGSITIGPSGGGLAFWLMMLGFGLNAAFIPIHTWLPDAYPRGTLTGSVFMCVYTTKTGVYVLARYFSGVEFVAYMGVIMCVYGVIMALMQNDARKLLSYHIISQVGYMVAGVGIGTELAINGAIAHVFNHILYKGLLFMCMGSVIMMTGKRKLSELGGLAKYMPVTCICCIIASLSISGAPGFNGYISKGMVILSSVEGHAPFLELMMILAAVGTFLSFVKLCYYTFFAENKEIKAKESPWNMRLAMILTAFSCVLIGVYPKVLYYVLPYPVHYHAYTADHVIGTVQLFLFSGLVFMLAKKYFDPHKALILDFDYFYRMIARAINWSCDKILNDLRIAVQNIAINFRVFAVNLGDNPSFAPKKRPIGIGAGGAIIFLFIFGLIYISLG
ncbi:MAG: Na(+)/H(+) antiporter subunit D [Deltaproteobacteria bacterium]|nr:Na(+)/H(+) antiporter subunit D [Deltaproteobacteria bacterium]